MVIQSSMIWPRLGSLGSLTCSSQTVEPLLRPAGSRIMLSDVALSFLVMRVGVYDMKFRVGAGDTGAGARDVGAMDGRE